jgi:hypothetical protein
MKKRAPIGTTLLLLVLVYPVGQSGGREISGWPTTAYVADVWIGMSNDDNHFYRCELTADRRGRFVSIYRGTDEVTCIDISSWELSGTKISIDLVPVSGMSKGDITFINGEVHTRLLLIIRGDGWFSTATLWKESEWDHDQHIAEDAARKAAEGS